MFKKSIIIILFFYFSGFQIIHAQINDDSTNKLNKEVEWIGTCQTKVIAKAELNGFGSLTLQEKIEYYFDTYRCEYKSEAKRVHRYIDNKQLKNDASNSGKFFGKSGSIAYCTMALLLFLTLT